MQVGSLAIAATFSNAWVRPSAMICVKLPQPVLRQMWPGDPVHQDLRAATTGASLPRDVAWMGLTQLTDEEPRDTAGGMRHSQAFCMRQARGSRSRVCSVYSLRLHQRVLDDVLIGQTQSVAQCCAEGFQSMRDTARVGCAAQLADARAALRDCFHAHARHSPMRIVSRRLHMASGAPTAHAAQRVDRSSSGAAVQGYAVVGTAHCRSLCGQPHSMHIGTGTAQQAT